MEIIIWIVAFYIIIKIIKFFLRAKWIYGMLIYNDEFLLKPYSRDDMDLMKQLEKSNSYSPMITSREILIFKWFLIREVIHTIYKKWIKQNECRQIIEWIDERIPRFFSYELKWISNQEIDDRFKFYAEKISNFNEDTSNEIVYLLTTWKLDNWFSMDMLWSMYFSTYYIKQLECKNIIVKSLIDHSEYLKP